MSLRPLAPLVLVGAGLGCGMPASSLRLPPPGQVRELRIEGSDRGTGPGREVRISDPGRIAALLRQLEAVNSGFYTPWDTFPTPRYRIVLWGERAERLAVFLGPRWVGGQELQDPGREKRLRKLTKDQYEGLLKTLGVDADSRSSLRIRHRDRGSSSVESAAGSATDEHR